MDGFDSDESDQVWEAAIDAGRDFLGHFITRFSKHDRARIAAPHSFDQLHVGGISERDIVSICDRRQKAVGISVSRDIGDVKVDQSVDGQSPGGRHANDDDRPLASRFA